MHCHCKLHTNEQNLLRDLKNGTCPITKNHAYMTLVIIEISVGNRIYRLIITYYNIQVLKKFSMFISLKMISNGYNTKIIR